MTPHGFEDHELTAIADFEDIHCHGGGGYFFSSDELSGISAASQYHLQHGSTSLIASLVTETHADLAEQVRRDDGDTIQVVFFKGEHLGLVS
ncbi:MAG: hypothetical protein HY050_01760 [Actinobacteria bacterium]|nr:hypothetical protein [Actinomycetota bacterium]